MLGSTIIGQVEREILEEGTHNQVDEKEVGVKEEKERVCVCECVNV